MVWALVDGIRRSVQGLYIWGGVGRGKTMMMDMFCSVTTRTAAANALPPVYEARSRRIGAPFRSGQSAFRVADEIAAEGDILCFDEFFVSDIGDAMILGEGYDRSFPSRVTLIATSNVEPVNLCKWFAAFPLCACH